MASRVGNPVAFVESRFGIQMKRVGREEYAGPCPFCGGRDRFHVWTKGNYWCRPAPGHCGRAGWLDELDGAPTPTPEERLEWRVAALERKQAETEQRLSALEAMHKCTDHLAYHANLNHHTDAVDYWLQEGMTPDTIHNYQLGYCPSCPTAPGFASYTIPVTYRGKLYNIRHRLARPNDGGKYRPHMAGLPVLLFNADALHAEANNLLVVEGEKKAMVVGQETGLATIATMGMQAFKRAWANDKRFARFSTIYVLYDPDATDKAREVAAYFNGRGRVVTMPFKADDYFVLYDGTRAGFLSFLKNARSAD